MARLSDRQDYKMVIEKHEVRCQHFIINNIEIAQKKDLHMSTLA